MDTNTALGCNVWWYVPKTSVDVIKVQTYLQKHGFEAKDIPVPSRHREVSMAINSFKNRRGKDNRRIVEEVKDTTDEFILSILEREQDGEQVDFKSKTFVRLDKSTGSVTVEGKLREEVLKVLPECQGKIDDTDIRGFLYDVVKMCKGVPKKPSGGIYFVPAKLAGIIENAQAVLNDLNGAAKIYVERIMDGIQERANVWESVEKEVEDRLEKTVAELGRIERLSAVKGKQADIEEATNLMKVYQQLLGEEAKFEDIAEKIEAAVRQVSEKMALIAPAAPVVKKEHLKETILGIMDIPKEESTEPTKMTDKKPVKSATPKETGKGRITVVDAAITVLKQIGKATGYKEITDAAVKQGLYKATCEAPYDSFIACLNRAIKVGEKRVVRVARGVYGLAA